MENHNTNGNIAHTVNPAHNETDFSSQSASGGKGETMSKGTKLDIHALYAVHTHRDMRQGYRKKSRHNNYHDFLKID